MKRHIIVPIEAGEKECDNNCNWEVRRFGAKCRIFGEMISELATAPLLRCPTCLEAGAKLKTLVEAVAGTETLVSIYGSEAQKETMRQALAAIKEP